MERSKTRNSKPIKLNNYGKENNKHNDTPKDNSDHVRDNRFYGINTSMAIPNAKDTHNRVSNTSNINSVHRALLRYKRQGIQRQAWNQLKQTIENYEQQN